MDRDHVISVKNLSAGRMDAPVLKAISFVLPAGSQLAITGASGSGKTTLGLALAGRLFYRGTIEITPPAPTIAWVDQQHHFKNRSNTSDLYYQQRYNSYDAEEAQTAGESLGAGSRRVLEIMQIGYLHDRPLVQLSSGENKKLQLAQALLLQPSILIMDQPFTGLDAATRTYLDELLGRLAGGGMTIIVICGETEVPSCITHVAVLENGSLASMQDRDQFMQRAVRPVANHGEDHSSLKTLMTAAATQATGSVIRMNG
ncbi:MAG: ATP-binding cassette domain-containing protein, partial [Chitinophagaceae bacterium]